MTRSSFSAYLLAIAFAAMAVYVIIGGKREVLWLNTLQLNY